MSEPVRTPADAPCIGRRRDAVLHERRWFTCGNIVVTSTTAEKLIHQTAAFRESLDSTGLMIFQLNRPLYVGEFVALASTLGVPEPETEKSLMERVVEEVVLNITSDSPCSVTEHNQPFTTQPLTYHVEGSRRPAGTAPTYLMFQCLQGPAMDSGGQTIVRSIPDTLAALSPNTQKVLAETVLCPELTTVTVICERAGRRTLNVRDPAPAEFRWRSVYPDGDVAEALMELLWVIYDPAAAIGFPWRDGMVAVLDNHRWLHARTSGRPGRRHLQRIRIQA